MPTLVNLPLRQPTPDAAGFIDCMRGRARKDHTPLVEYLIADVVMKPIVTEVLGRQWMPFGEDRATQKKYLDNLVEFWYRLGYDCIRFERGPDYRRNLLVAPDTAPGSEEQRGWVDQHRGAITSWQDFEAYTWPQADSIDFFWLEYLNSHLPKGMGILSCHAGGIFEWLSHLMSYEGLCLTLHDNPDLVQAVVDRIGEIMTVFNQHLLDLDRVVAIFQGDDMGFRSGTLIAPADLRKYILPWHKRFAATAHARGLPYFLHSCGNLEMIMGDLISDVGIDGKHSFEDLIQPVQDFQASYGSRVAVLGGVDVDRLASGSPEAVRQHTRFLVETCGGRGRFAVGSGNSIPSYIPAANYLAMVDEALAGRNG